jgi:hypothetical protein
LAFAAVVFALPALAERYALAPLFAGEPAAELDRQVYQLALPAPVAPR